MIGDAEGRELLASDGRRVVLGKLIKSGGAGSVYRVRGLPDLVGKLYHHDNELALYERKVAAMIALSPELPPIDEGGRHYVQIAWPRALLRDARNRFVGYLMPAVDVDATSELECILQEKQARSFGLPTGLGAKITLAANLAGVIAELHRQHHRVVDLKPVNLRFYPSSLYMAMLDCDGFSIQGKDERFEAPQFTVDYLAPEFQRGGLNAAGEEVQDRFALAVIVFQLLNFGIHPFTGRPQGEGVPTDIPGRVEARLYAYGVRGNPRLLPSPVSGHEAMPADLRLLFDRAFGGSAGGRPSALEWGSLLRSYAQRSSLRLTHCTAVREHQHFAGMPCAACARAALLNMASRGSPIAAATPAPGRTANLGGKSGFGRAAPAPVLAAAWQRVRGQAATRAPAPPPPPPAPTAGNFPPWSWPPQAPTRTPRAATGTGIGLSNWWQSTSSMNRFRTVMVGLVVVFFGGANLLRALDAPSRPSDYQPPPTSYSPPPSPTPQSELETPTADGQPFAPLPVARDDLSAQPTRDELNEVDVRASEIAQALAPDDDSGVQRFNLWKGANERSWQERAQSSADTYEYLTGMRGSNAATRQGAMVLLAQEVARMQPDNADASCKWSWLAMLEGESALARSGFVRTLWADPLNSCGWLGLGLLDANPEASYGALVMAERIDMSNQRQRQLRDAFIEAALTANHLSVPAWRVLDARARVRSGRARGLSVPKDVQELAKQALPANGLKD